MLAPYPARPQADLTKLQQKLTKAKSDKAHYANKQVEEEEKLAVLRGALDGLTDLVEQWTKEVVRPCLHCPSL